MNHHEVHQIARAVADEIKARWEREAIEFFHAQALRLTLVEQQLARALEMLTTLSSQPVAGIVGGAIAFSTLTPTGDPPMYIMPDTYTGTLTIIPPQAVDAAGRPVPDAQLTYEVASNPAPDAAGSGPGLVIVPDPTNPLSYAVTKANDNDDGTPAVVSVTVAVKSPDGTLVGSFGDHATVTAGPVSAIKGGGIGLSGLTPSA